MDLDRERKVAFTAARAAGELLRERVGKIKDIDYKGAYNIVTDVDKASERTVLDILRADFPDDHVLAEEGGDMGAASNRRWLIDPLDGTTNYTHAYPFFCVSIGLESKGRMVLGVVYNPIADELFWAEIGKGAWLNDQEIRVSGVSALSNSLLATGFPPDTRRSLHNNMDYFSSITDVSHGVRRDGAAALDLCFVACGRLDGFWEMKLSPWDTAAGSLIVSEAGGNVTDLDGGPFDMDTGHVLATNGLIHDEVVQALQTIREKQPAAAKQKNT